MSIGRVPGATGIQPSIVDAKGDIIAATAADSVSRLAVGTNGQYLKADSTAATGLSWATLPASGKVLQVVTATYSTNFTTTSTTYVDTGMSATITPTSATSTILVLHNGNYNQTSAASAVNIRLLRGATNIKTYNAQGYTNNNLFRGEITLIKMDSPATTSATTYKIQISNDTTATIGAQYNNEESTIILI